MFKLRNINRLSDIVAVTVSLLLHGVLFFLFKNFLFQKTQFSVLAGNSSIEFELIAAPGDNKTTENPSAFKNKISSVVEKQDSEKSEVLTTPSESFSESSLLQKMNQTIKVSTNVSRQIGKGNLLGSNAETLIANGKGSPMTAQPDYLRNPPPIYPEISRRLREEGTVWLKTSVNAKGRATQINIFKSSGFDRLDKAAQNSVKQWRFRPAQFAGLAVESIVEIPIIFQLK